MSTVDREILREQEKQKQRAKEQAASRQKIRRLREKQDMEIGALTRKTLKLNSVAEAREKLKILNAKTAKSEPKDVRQISENDYKFFREIVGKMTQTPKSGDWRISREALQQFVNEVHDRVTKWTE